jgi:hypothetical protein
VSERGGHFGGMSSKCLAFRLPALPLQNISFCFYRPVPGVPITLTLQDAAMTLTLIGEQSQHRTCEKEAR